MKAVRWRRYGQDRTYFTSDTGQELGWIDNVSGHVEAWTSSTATEIRKWTAMHGRPAPRPGRGRTHRAVAPEPLRRLGAQLLSGVIRAALQLGTLLTRFVTRIAVALLIAVLAYAILMNSGKNMIEAANRPAPQAIGTP